MLDVAYPLCYTLRMPNHCENTLLIRGTASRVRDFCRDHYRRPTCWDGGIDETKTTLDFSFSVPYPDGDRTVLATSSNSGWYDWHCAHWGTKWNAYDVYPEDFPYILTSIAVQEKSHNFDVRKDVEARYDFSTAWSPPTNWLATMCGNYPDLTFTLRFKEYGMDFMGIQQCSDGLETRQETYGISEELELTNDDDTDWDEVVTKVEIFLKECSESA